jgi:hypothetical protein
MKSVTPAFGRLTSGGCPLAIQQSFPHFVLSEAIIFHLLGPLLAFGPVGLLTFYRFYFRQIQPAEDADWSIAFW